MTDDTTVAAATAAVPAAKAEPAESEKAKPDTGVLAQDTAPEATASTEDKEKEQSEPETDEDSPRPKLSRTQRLQRKAARLSTMLAEREAELEGLRKQSDKDNADSEPKEADFNGDYLAFERAKTAHEAARLIRKDLDARDARTESRDLAKRAREATDDFFDRVEDVKNRIPDYDTAIAAFAAAGGQFAPHVREEIRDSDSGPALAYHLAKNPGLVAELNALSPRDAAREIGRLEAKVSLPQPKKQTQAPKPIVAPAGGAMAPKDILSLAKQDDLSGYIKARNEEDAARRK